MPDAIMAALSGERILLSNSLATVTTSCVVIKGSDGHSKTVVSLDLISGVKRVFSSMPGFLVIAAGLLLVAAAAHYSKDGGSADLPLALAAGVFGIGYLVTRRASVALVVNGDVVETTNGSLRQAAVLARTIETARSRRIEDSAEISTNSV